MQRLSRAMWAALLLTSSITVAQDPPESVLAPTKDFRKRVVVAGLAGPWEITWGPDAKLWVTERTGKRISRVDPATGAQEVAITIDEVSAPGGQDGLLGLALHPDLLKNKGTDWVYAFYTYVDEAKGPDPSVPDPRNPYRYLYGKLVRLTYDKATGKLASPVTLLSGLPAGNDHVAGRVKFGPDRKIYLTLGDQGNNQLGNFCLPVESQRLPTRQEIAAKDWASYVGKSLRINLDGSIPHDNPNLNGAVSHVFTYGHRNIQGIDFGPNGALYAAEHGPKTDDEINVLKSGGNYGWPHVAGMRDNKAFQYARWAEASTPCSQLKFSDLAIHPSVPREDESDFKKPMIEPLATMFTVPTGFNFSDPKCAGVDYICWPTVGISGIEHFSSKVIPGWGKVLLVTTLKRGSLYIQPLTPDGQKPAAKMSRYFRSENRYRDTAVSPDGSTIFVATDPGGLTESATGGVTRRMKDPGAILAFRYEREGAGAVIEEAATTSQQRQGAVNDAPMAGPDATLRPQFTAAQVAAGKTAYNSYCAVCHGSTMTNGTFGTPLAGEYFKKQWFGRTVRGLYDKSRKTMPPASPGSLRAESYADVLAYILETNGFKAGGAPLADGGSLSKMAIR